jgi:hypothetical protein
MRKFNVQIADVNKLIAGCLFVVLNHHRNLPLPPVPVAAAAVRIVVPDVRVNSER